MDYQAIEVGLFLWAVMFEFFLPEEFLYSLIEASVVFGNLAGIPWFTARRVGLRNVKTIMLFVIAACLIGYFGYVQPGYSAIPATLPLSVLVGVLWYELLFQWEKRDKKPTVEAAKPVL